MKQKWLTAFAAFILLLAGGLLALSQTKFPVDSRLITYVVNPKKQKLKLYWKDERENRFRNFQQLKQWLDERNEPLQFAMNAGMYKPDHSPVGLYIESGKTLSPIDTAKGSGNFYLKPNGVFYITEDDNAVICNTTDFVNSRRIKYATQSGPMLLTEGTIHPAFTKGSLNKTIKNGVGILPGGNVVFAISKEPVSFYDFADFFKKQGCKNALYLDGFVSRMYLPEKQWIQTDGDFGVIIGVLSSKKH